MCSKGDLWVWGWCLQWGWYCQRFHRSHSILLAGCWEVGNCCPHNSESAGNGTYMQVNTVSYILSGQNFTRLSHRSEKYVQQGVHMGQVTICRISEQFTRLSDFLCWRKRIEYGQEEEIIIRWYEIHSWRTTQPCKLQFVYLSKKMPVQAIDSCGWIGFGGKMEPPLATVTLMFGPTFCLLWTQKVSKLENGILSCETTTASRYKT